MNQNKATLRYHIAIIALLLLSNTLVLSITISLEKKNKALEQQLQEAYVYDQYAEDLSYSLR